MISQAVSPMIPWADDGYITLLAPQIQSYFNTI